MKIKHSEWELKFQPSYFFPRILHIISALFKEWTESVQSLLSQERVNQPREDSQPIQVSCQRFQKDCQRFQYDISSTFLRELKFEPSFFFLGILGKSSILNESWNFSPRIFPRLLLSFDFVQWEIRLSKAWKRAFSFALNDFDLERDSAIHASMMALAAHVLYWNRLTHFSNFINVLIEWEKLKDLYHVRNAMR